MNNSSKAIGTVAASIPIILCSNAAVEAKDLANAQLQQDSAKIIIEAQKRNSADLLLAKAESDNSTPETASLQIR